MSPHHQSLDELRPRILRPPALRQPVRPDPPWIRCDPGDFLVEELPLQPASGIGEHLLVLVEKRGITHAVMMTRVARALGISTREIGSAGRKDRHAITRQYLSVPESCGEKLRLIDCDELGVLSATRHSRKLRTGQLCGNRFELILRWKRDNASQPDEPHRSASLPADVRQAMQELADSAMPNYFGPQRFGHGGSTVRDGIALLKGEITRRRFLSENSEGHLRFALSAAQSALFNVLLADRVDARSVTHVEAGDVVKIKDSERWFAENTGRINDDDRQSLVIGGPMFGRRMPKADLTARDREDEILKRFGLKLTDFDRFRRLTAGTRRAIAVRPMHTAAETTQPADNQSAALRIRFELPAGSYATVLLRELFGDFRDGAGRADDFPDGNSIAIDDATNADC